MSQVFSNGSKNNYVSFNQDATSIAVAHNNGCMFYNTSDIVNRSSLQGNSVGSSKFEHAECILVERLFTSGLLVLVDKRDRRVLHVFKLSSAQLIVSHRFSKTVIAVKLNRDRMVVCLEDNMHIYNLFDMKHLYSMQDLVFSNSVQMDMTVAEGTALVAVPESRESGMVFLFDAIRVAPVTNFSAHNAPIACLKFNEQGNMLATAGIRGTVIRVYSVPEGKMLHEFCRGATCVTITSLRFSTNSFYLCSSSNTDTVHVYKLKEENEDSSVTGWLKSQMKSMSDLISVERSFAYARLPANSSGNQVAFITSNGAQFLIVASLEGYAYVFHLLENGGNLPLAQQHRIGTKPDVDRVFSVLNPQN
uniref:WD_REPEATS_REGION domain-containing protein n=1 Tax=Caenorhabditis japonica TaxID=281687 RepID=A0A8R1DH12_CAEJA